jgi:cytochrome c-type biogenesis protein CcmH/NrfF
MTIEQTLLHRIAHCDTKLAGDTARRMLELWRQGERKQDVIDWVLFGTYPDDWEFEE